MHPSPGSLHETPRARLELELALEHAGPYEARRGEDFPPHRHSTWELVYYRTGHIECPVGEEVFESRPGMIILTPPGTIHAEYARTAYANYFIAVAAPAQAPWPRVCFDDQERTFGTLFAAVAREWQGQAAERDRLLALLLAQLDILLRREQEQRHLSDGERLVREAERIMEARSATSVTIGEIAGEVGVCPSSLRAQFARRRGRSPRSYLQALRVQRALALIRTSSLTLEEVSGLCGYDSASHLSRHVKRATGRSPGALRRG